MNVFFDSGVILLGEFRSLLQPGIEGLMHFHLLHCAGYPTCLCFNFLIRIQADPQLQRAVPCPL